MNQKKICFTIMGFGKKADPSNGKIYDLDKTYQNIIKPAVELCKYTSIRADEIQGSGLIDKSMYALLVRADLVIADITTFNPNALYELGIRHAARPNSTIILKSQEGKIPFDLNHNRFLVYTHLGEDIGATEAKICQKRLTDLIKAVEEANEVDSPLFIYLSDINPHQLSEMDYQELINSLVKRENSIFAISEKAKSLMSNSDFLAAADFWAKASELAPEEPYFIQQQSLCTYKSELPSKVSSLTEALVIISKLYIENETNDPETLGLYGAIHKRLYEVNKDIEILKTAIESYRRGFVISTNYYNGENYATCLDLMAKESKDSDESISCRFQAREVRRTVVQLLLKQMLINDSSNSEDQDNKWIYASLANCYFNLGDFESGGIYENKFIALQPLKWEKETYYKHKPILN